MLNLLGFGNRKIEWVFACLKSTKVSIIVNGSPAKEFRIEISVIQRDLLSLCLFIKGSEGLKVAMTEAFEKGIF